MRLSIIACLGKNRAIGLNNKLLWHLPDDLANFQRLTTKAGPVIMGRKTFESIGHPLPNRQNIVLSKTPQEIPGCHFVNTLEQALELISENSEAFVIGGENVFRQTLTLAQKLYLTEVNDAPLADTFFPEFDRNEFPFIYQRFHPEDERHEFEFMFREYERLS